MLMKLSRRRRLSVSPLNQHSMRFGHGDEVWGLVDVPPVSAGGVFEPFGDVVMLVSAVVVHNEVDGNVAGDDAVDRCKNRV